MKAVYFDTIGGIAGDMTLAAFLSAGMPFEALADGLQSLALGGVHLEHQRVRRNAIDAVHLDVVITDAPHYHRHLKDILGIIDQSSLPAGVKTRAGTIFRVIAEAEATVHNAPLEKVHFHEVGALDSIVDIVGTAICLDTLGIERVYSSPVKLGSGGIVATQHGPMPTPAPATAEILKDYPVVLTKLPYELTTPTGAAIIRALSQGVLDREQFRIQAIGYGAGTKEFPELPNMLRVLIGEVQAPAGSDAVISLETTIDDMNPQLYPYLIERLLAAGAVEAYLTPVVMKKGRPGITVCVLSDPAHQEEVTACLFRETTTIGLRIQTLARTKLPRRLLEVPTSLGTVKAKGVMRDGTEQIMPEFEECRRIALERNLPVAEVMRILHRELGS